MAFVAEDGTGVPGANSYASVAQADAYFSEAGVAGWAGSTADKQGALVRATRYIMLRWASRLVILLGPGRVLPYNLVAATCEYALRTLDGKPLAPDPVVDASGVSVVRTRKKVGPIENEFAVVGGDAATASMYRSYPVPDALIATLFVATGGGTIGQRRVIR